MIFLRLTRQEAEKGDLPQVCVRCGAPSFVSYSKRLMEGNFGPFFVFCAWAPMLALLAGFLAITWMPPGSDEAIELYVPYLLAASVHVLIFGGVRQRWATVRLPFCARHHLHWFKCWVVDVGSFIFSASVLVFMLNLTGLMKPSAAWLGWQRRCGLILSLHLTVWMTWKVVCRFRALQANEIADRTITLRGIHPSFRAALWRWRHERRKATRPEQSGADDADVAAIWQAATAHSSPRRSTAATSQPSSAV